MKKANSAVGAVSRHINPILLSIVYSRRRLGPALTSEFTVLEYAILCCMHE